jgi:hypothetical protein
MRGHKGLTNAFFNVKCCGMCSFGNGDVKSLSLNSWAMNVKKLANFPKPSPADPECCKMVFAGNSVY